jgi:hypothetical protein
MNDVAKKSKIANHDVNAPTSILQLLKPEATEKVESRAFKAGNKR